MHLVNLILSLPDTVYARLCGCVAFCLVHVFGIIRVCQSDMLFFVAVWLALWCVWHCGCQSNMFSFVAVWLCLVFIAVSLTCWALSPCTWSVWRVGLCCHVAVCLTCWALSPHCSQSDMLSFVAMWLSVWHVGLCCHVAVSLTCWALLPCGCQSDMLGFVAMWLHVSLTC